MDLERTNQQSITFSPRDSGEHLRVWNQHIQFVCIEGNNEEINESIPDNGTYN